MNNWTTNSSSNLQDRNGACNEQFSACPLSTSLQVIIFFLLIILLLVGVSGNGLVCIVIFRKASMKSGINILLANLALGQLLQVIFCVPYALAVVISGWSGLTSSNQLDRTAAYIFAWSSFVITFTILIIGFERLWVIVQRNTRHRRLLSTAKATVFSVICWCVGATFSAPFLSDCCGVTRFARWLQPVVSAQAAKSVTSQGVRYTFVYYVVACIIPSFVYFLELSICTVMIIKRWKTSKSCRRKISSAQSSSPVTSILSSPPASSTLNIRTSRFCVNGGFSHLERKQSTKTLFLQLRTLITVLLVAANFFVCWTLYSMFLFAWCINETMDTQWLAGNLLTLLVYINAATNPVIYWWRMKKFRDACRESASNCSNSLHLIRRMICRRLNQKQRVYPDITYECSNPAVSFSQL